MRTFEQRAGVLPLLIGFFAVITLTPLTFIFAAEGCPQPNEVPIKTVEDRRLATAAGIPVSAICWDPKSEYVGASAAKVKEFLWAHRCHDQMPTGKAPACPNGTRPLRVDGLNPKFAECVVKYIEKFEAQYGPKTICLHDAYRAPGEQQCARNSNSVAAAGTSRHELGQAVDLNPRGVATYTSMRKFADENEGGIWFRYPCAQDTSAGNGKKSGPNDCPHMELRAAACGTPGFMPPTAAAPYTAPTSPLTQAIRSALGVPTQPQTAIPQQTFATPQSPISAFTQPSTATAGTPTTEPGVDFTNFTGTPQSTSTTANQLEDLLSNNKATTSTSTGLKVPLIINPNDRSDRVASVTPTTTQKTAQAWTQAPVPSTFISNDIAWTGEVTNAQGTGTLNSYTRILTSIRDALLQLLSRLRPFGGRPTVEYAE